MENDEKKESPKAPQPKSGGMMKIILYGGIGLVLMLVVAVGTVKMLGDEAPAEETEVVDAPKEEHTESTDKHSTDDAESHLSEEEDMKVIDQIMENLEFLDYEPDLAELEAEENKMSIKDSTAAVDWLKSEKKRLAKREAELDKQITELKKLDRTVTKKLLILEQAESVRTTKLARLYDGMEPRSVAKLLANLDDATVVSILPRMKAKNASQVMAIMPPRRAAKLSKQMITIAVK